MGIREIRNIKKEILDTRCWIKKVIASVETEDQLDAARRMVDNWFKLTYRKIKSFKPLFFHSLDDWKSSLETHFKAKNEMESHLAIKRAKIRFPEKDEM